MLLPGWTGHCFKVVLISELEVLAIVMGGAQKVSTLQKGGGAQTVLPCLQGGGGRKSFGPAISHFVAPLPVINDQSLGVLLVIIGYRSSHQIAIKNIKLP